MVYALVRIKRGAEVFQDFCCYVWPPETEQEKRVAKVDGDTVFVAEKQSSGKWICTAPNAGYKPYGSYGNGSITACDVEFLTPMLSVEPTEHERQQAQQRGD